MTTTLKWTMTTTMRTKKENENENTSGPTRQWARVQKLVGNAVPSPRRDVQVGRGTGPDGRHNLFCASLSFVLFWFNPEKGLVLNVFATKMHMMRKKKVCVQTESLVCHYFFPIGWKVVALLKTWSRLERTLQEGTPHASRVFFFFFLGERHC